jgi:transcriptional regulator GlxA family with amidase domain
MQLEDLAWLRRAKDLMDRDFEQPLAVPQVAAAAHMSEAHFTRAFRREYGETPAAYLMTRRIARAKTLLRTTDMPVTEICLEVGFRSLGSFSAKFSEVVGSSPSDYRRAVGGPQPPVPPCLARAWLRPSRNGEAQRAGRA